MYRKETADKGEGCKERQGKRLQWDTRQWNIGKTFEGHIRSFTWLC